MTSPSPGSAKRPSGWATFLACGCLLIVFAITSYSAVVTKNATIDEPLHSLSGWLELRHDDFRVLLVNPPLWQCWAALGNVLCNPPLKFDSPLWNDLTWEPVEEYAWTARMLYQTPGTDGDAFVNRSRAMMLVLGIGLGAVIAGWSYRLAGPVAAVVATLFFSLDPNFIAHAPLVKSDVALALVMTGFAWAVWSLGQRVTLGKTVLLGLLCGAAVGVKFSGVIVGPMLAVMLLVRAMSSWPWVVGNRTLSTRAQRVAAAGAIGFFCAALSFVFVWGCYGFRFRPSPSPNVRINMQAIYDRTALTETTVAVGHLATADEVSRHRPSLLSQIVRFADEHHLLPQAMLGGMLYQRDCTLIWPAFLDGELYGDGRWSYFPSSMLYKTPIATLTAFAVAMVLGCGALLGNARKIAPLGRPLRGEMDWTVACLLIPFAIFAVVAMRTPLNIGMRTVLPLYPFLFIAVGCAAAWSWSARPRLTGILVAVLGVGLAAETFAAWPDYIAFFNAVVGGEAGGIRHLSDSNLDWGQDIKPLAAWQAAHPPVPMFIDYDGAIDPHFYGLKYHPLWFDPSGRPVSDVPLTPGLLAIRATHLQGMYIKPPAAPFYEWLRSQQPIAVIGGTIYVYPFTPGEFEQVIRHGD